MTPEQALYEMERMGEYRRETCDSCGRFLSTARYEELIARAEAHRVPPPGIGNPCWNMPTRCKNCEDKHGVGWPEPLTQDDF